MAAGKAAALYCGWVLLGCSVPIFVLAYYDIGPGWLPLSAVALLVVGILWQVKASPAFRTQFRLEEAAKNYEAVLREKGRASGDERILQANALRLEPESDRSVWLSQDDETIGSVVGTYAMGRIWITALDSDETTMLQLRCANPGAWYHYGYKRKVRWSVADSDGEKQIGVIELRPTFLGRFRWRIRTETDAEFGQVKAGVEWSRMVVGLGGAVTAAIIPNLAHHATVFMQSQPVCAVSWSGCSAALTFGPEKWQPAERKLAIATAVLLACCPDYYRHG
jgi:hypothetical protein